MSLLGSVLGFSSSFLPEILNYFKANQQHKQDLEKMKLQTELMARQSELRLHELDKKADIEETKGLYEHSKSLSGSGGFVDALRGSVRPVVTYLFLALFIATEIVIMVKVLESGGDWQEAVLLMWTPETQGIFSVILSFWFGSRAVSKYMSKK